MIPKGRTGGEGPGGRQQGILVFSSALIMQLLNAPTPPKSPLGKGGLRGVEERVSLTGTWGGSTRGQ